MVCGGGGAKIINAIRICDVSVDVHPVCDRRSFILTVSDGHLVTSRYVCCTVWACACAG
jgi:hypothetical protein